MDTRVIATAIILLIIVPAIISNAEQIGRDWKSIIIEKEPGVYRVKLVVVPEKPSFIAIILNGNAYRPQFMTLDYSGNIDNWYSYLVTGPVVLDLNVFTSDGRINITLASSSNVEVKTLAVERNDVDFNKPYINIGFNAALCGLVIKVDGKTMVYYDKNKCSAYGIAEEAANIGDNSIVEIWAYWKKGGYAYVKLRVSPPKDKGEDTITVLAKDGCHPFKSWPYIQAWARGIVYEDLNGDGVPDTHYSPQSKIKYIKLDVCQYQSTSTTSRSSPITRTTTTVTKTVTVTRTTTLPRITTTITSTTVTTTTVVNNVTTTITETVTRTVPITTTTTITAAYPTTTTTVLAAAIAVGETFENKYFYAGLGVGIILLLLTLLFLRHR